MLFFIMPTFLSEFRKYLHRYLHDDDVILFDAYVKKFLQYWRIL